MDQMLEKASRCRNSGDRLEAVLAEIDSIVNDLFSSWQGEAQDAYFKRILECRDSAADLISLLYELSDGIEHVAQIYSKVESNMATASDPHTLIIK